MPNPTLPKPIKTCRAYVMDNPAIPGSVQIVIASTHAKGKKVKQSTNQIFDHVEVRYRGRRTLYDLEAEIGERLQRFRIDEDKGVFNLPPTDALQTLREIIQDGSSVPNRAWSQGLARKRDAKSRRHWHVWVQSGKNEVGQVVTLTSDMRIYWSKSGAQGRAKRHKQNLLHADFLLCTDQACPAYGKRRTDL